MPHISIQGPPLAVENKRKLVREITESMSSHYGIPKEKIMIHISEFNKESTASGGVLLVDK